MAFGSVQYVVVCVANGGGAGTSVAPCVDEAGAGYSPGVMQAYLVDPSFGDAIAAALAAPDPVEFAAFFSGVFCFTLVLYFFARGIGFLFDAIREF